MLVLESDGEELTVTVNKAKHDKRTIKIGDKQGNILDLDANPLELDSMVEFLKKLE